LITVIDGHPATCSGPAASRVAGLGVEHFGQTGTARDLYRQFGIDRNAILAMITALSPGRPLRVVGRD
jgi:pyruvate dehydrogenase E1 component